MELFLPSKLPFRLCGKKCSFALRDGGDRQSKSLITNSLPNDKTAEVRRKRSKQKDWRYKILLRERIIRNSYDPVEKRPRNSLERIIDATTIFFLVVNICTFSGEETCRSLVFVVGYEWPSLKKGSAVFPQSALQSCLLATSFLPSRDPVRTVSADRVTLFLVGYLFTLSPVMTY